MPINVEKKLEKLNRFMKKTKKHIYEWTYYSKHALSSDYKYIDIYQEIKELVKKEFSVDKCSIYNLGSRVMGLAEEDESDLDIFVDIDDENYWKSRNYKEDLEIIKKLKTALENDKNWNVKSLYIRVPSIKVTHVATGIRCDISITNGMAVENSKLFAHLFSIQTEAIAFLHFIRRWLRIFDIKKLKGFSLTLLVVFFLQSKKLMPTIKQVQELVSPIVILDGYEVQFDSTRTRKDYEIHEMKDYQQWLKPFFKFFSNDIYQDKVICTFYGELFEKSDYPHDKLLNDPSNSSYPMTIPAPILRHSNVAKAVKSLDIAQFMEACHFSSHYFDKFTTRNSIDKFYGFDPYKPNIEE